MSAPDLPELTKDARVALEIDLRLQELWAVLLGRDPGEDITHDTLATAIHYAYGRGYYDAMLDGEDKLGPAAGYPQWEPPEPPSS